MTDEEAREEARRRWGVHGGWALRGTALDDGTVGPLQCRVGARIHMPGERYSRRVTFGAADEWEGAFARAERWLELNAPKPRRHVSAQERAERRGGLPMAGDLFGERPPKDPKRR